MARMLLQVVLVGIRGSPLGRGGRLEKTQRLGCRKRCRSRAVLGGAVWWTRVVIRGGQGRLREQKRVGGDGKDSSKMKGVEEVEWVGRKAPYPRLKA